MAKNIHQIQEDKKDENSAVMSLPDKKYQNICRIFCHFNFFNTFKTHCEKYIIHSLYNKSLLFFLVKKHYPNTASSIRAQSSTL